MLGFTKLLIKFVNKGICTYYRNLVHITYKKTILCQLTQEQPLHFKLLQKQVVEQAGQMKEMLLGFFLCFAEINTILFLSKLNGKPIIKLYNI